MINHTYLKYKDIIKKTLNGTVNSDTYNIYLKVIEDDIVNRNFWFILGYLYVGILYYDFIRWLRINLIRKGIKKVYFLTRDGVIMKKIYNFMYPKKTNGSIKTSLLYSSRRLMNIPAITTINNETLDFLLSGRTTLRYKDYFERIGINLEILKKFNIPINTQVDTPDKFDQLYNIFKNSKKELLNIAEKERSVLKKYLTRKGFFSNKKVGLVDIGWRGTMQKSLSLICKKEKKGIMINGFYLGTFNYDYTRNLPMNGYLCEKGEPLKYFNLIRKCVEIFELFFADTSSSIVKLKMNNNTIHPIYDKSDNSKYKKYAITQIRKGAIKFIKKIIKIDKTLNNKNISYRNIIYLIFYRLLNHPLVEEVDMIGKIKHSESFGRGQNLRYIATVKGIQKYKNDLSLLVQDYSESLWHTGFKVKIKSLTK